MFHSALWRSVCTNSRGWFSSRNLHHEATAVELRLDLKPLSLPPEVLDRLIVLAGKGVTNDGVLVTS
jgi:hypothetical protein